MIFSTITNIAVIILCIGVLVQTTRMILAFRTFRKSDINETVAALDHATMRAAAAISELRYMLATETAANSRSLFTAEALRDELSVMVGVGNSIAERIMEAAALAAPVPQGDTADMIAAPPAPDDLVAAPKKSRSGKAAGVRPLRQRKATAIAPASDVAILSAGVH